MSPLQFRVVDLQPDAVCHRRRGRHPDGERRDHLFGRRRREHAQTQAHRTHPAPGDGATVTDQQTHNPRQAAGSCIIGTPDDFERKVPVLASTPGNRMRSVGLVVVGIVASGLLINAYLAIVARSLTASEYAYFGAFWSLAQVAGFGMFLSIEQQTARLLQTPGRPLGVLRAVLLTAA